MANGSHLGLFTPPPPKTLEDVRVPPAVLESLILRMVYHRQSITGEQLQEDLGLPFYGVLEPLLEQMRERRVMEITRGQMASISYVYSITELGRTMAIQSFENTTYTGTAPVALEDYIASVHAQTFRNYTVTWEDVQEAFQDLIFDDSILPQVGPALNSGRSLFLYGPPGNGKTSIAERIVRVMGDAIFIPSCLVVQGQFIQLFDPFNHEQVRVGEDHRLERPYDLRWRLIRRPFIITGGELTLASLDLIWNNEAKFYEAPFQLKANTGGFMLDDFGRQKEHPRSLLNRWIVPLERRVDFLTLHTGTKIEIPFDAIIIFSTNLEPKDLVDEAFLRRIRYKIPILSPTVDNFKRIWDMQCRSRGLASDPRMVDYLLYRQVFPRGKPLRACYARDVLDHIDDICRFTGVPVQINEKLIEHACEAYFVTLDSREVIAKAKMEKERERGKTAPIMRQAAAAQKVAPAKPAPKPAPTVVPGTATAMAFQSARPLQPPQQGLGP